MSKHSRLSNHLFSEDDYDDLMKMVSNYCIRIRIDLSLLSHNTIQSQFRSA